jgi:hypothetical protein
VRRPREENGEIVVGSLQWIMREADVGARIKFGGLIAIQLPPGPAEVRKQLAHEPLEAAAGVPKESAMRIWRIFCSAVVLSAILLCVGCGTGPSTPPQVVSVAVTAGLSTVLLGNTVQMSANVSGTSNSSVSWSVSGSGTGSVGPTGLYTAPADLPKSVTVTVTATSQADPSKSGTATLTITSDLAVSLQATPSGASSIAFNEALTLAATITSNGKPDTSMAWAVNGVPNGNSIIGTISTLGTTVTYTAPASPAQVTITATSAADSSKSASLPENIQALSAGAISNASPLPLTPIQIPTAGLNTAASVQIQFSNGLGYSVTENPIRVASDSTVTVATPLYADPVSGQVGPGTVSVLLIQGSQSTPPMNLDIQDLPPLSAYGTQLGEISRAVLNFDAMLLSRRINQLQALQALSTNTVDTTMAQSTLNTMLNVAIMARSDVDQVALNNSAIISAGNLPDGTPIQFDQISLDLMDRIDAVFLTQTFGTVLTTAASSAAATSLPPSRMTSKRARLFGRQVPFAQYVATDGPRLSSLETRGWPSTAAPQLSFSQLRALLTTMQTEKAASDLSSAAADAGATQNMFDQAAALINGLASSVSDLKVFRPATSSALGIGGALISTARVVADGYADLGAVIVGWATGNQNLVNVAIEDANSVPRNELYMALANVVLAIPAGAEVELLQSGASTVLNMIDTQEKIDSALQGADSTSLAITNSFPVPLVDTQGIASPTGNVNVPTNQGAEAPLSGIELSIPGVTLNTLADSNGTYQLFAPLQGSPFTYVNADVTIVDPISQTVLGSEVVDLSNMTTATPIQIPTIQGIACSNIDFDGDDPDCD